MMQSNLYTEFIFFREEQCLLNLAVLLMQPQEEQPQPCTEQRND